MVTEYGGTSRSLFVGSCIDQPYDAGMGLAMQDRELAEVLVQGNEDALLRGGLSEDRLIARIGWEIGYCRNVVPGCLEYRTGGAVDAAIQQDPHQALRSSIRSWPTIRRAYSRQARMSSRSSQS